MKDEPIEQQIENTKQKLIYFQDQLKGNKNIMDRKRLGRLIKEHNYL
jgi:hypothetical protein